MSPEVGPVTIPYEGGKLELDGTGLRVRPRWTRSVEIPWGEVAAVSPFPWMEQRRGALWTFSFTESVRIVPPPADDDASPEAMAARALPSSILTLDVVLRDWRTLAARAGLFTQVALRIKPTLGADDQPDPKEGLFELSLLPRWVRANPGTMLAALELLHRECRFTQIMHDM